MLTSREPTCFVVMPFGEKKDLDGREIDFDDIYRFFFKKAIEDLGLRCIRCDEIEESGSIHERMFERIYSSDVVVVDITTSNANVYYELGVRHALAKGVTVLIRRKGTTIPFNIQGLQVVEYDQARFASIEQAKNRIHQIIQNGLSGRRNDSPVHAVLDLNVEPEGKPVEETRYYRWQLKSRDDTYVGVVTGDIQNVRGIDVWVNSENTCMQMARPFDNTISGIIRYYGAERDRRNGQIKRDTIADALAENMKTRTAVDPGSVLVTTSGAMVDSHGVKRVFHAAAIYGQVGQGYVPIDNVARCVANSLAVPVEDHGSEELKSILFPLMATKSRQGSILSERVGALLNAAIEYVRANRDCPFREIYFLAYTDKERDVCGEILSKDDRLKDPTEMLRSDSDPPVAEPEVTAHPALPKQKDVQSPPRNKRT